MRTTMISPLYVVVREVGGWATGVLPTLQEADVVIQWLYLLPSVLVHLHVPLRFRARPLKPKPLLFYLLGYYHLSRIGRVTLHLLDERWAAQQLELLLFDPAADRVWTR